MKVRATLLIAILATLICIASLPQPSLASWQYQTTIQDDVGDSACRQSYTDIVTIYYGYNTTFIYVKYHVNGDIPSTSRKTVIYNVKFNLDPENSTGQNGKWDYLVRYKVKATGRTWSVYKWNRDTMEWDKIDSGKSTAYVSGDDLTIIIDKTVFSGLGKSMDIYPQTRMQRGVFTVKCDDVSVDPVPVPEPGIFLSLTVLSALILYALYYTRHR